jgi:hypothetical protein
VRRVKIHNPLWNLGVVPSHGIELLSLLLNHYAGSLVTFAFSGGRRWVRQVKRDELKSLGEEKIDEGTKGPAGSHVLIAYIGRSKIESENIHFQRCSPVFPGANSGQRIVLYSPPPPPPLPASSSSSSSSPSSRRYSFMGCPL